MLRRIFVDFFSEWSIFLSLWWVSENDIRKSQNSSFDSVQKEAKQRVRPSSIPLMTAKVRANSI